MGTAPLRRVSLVEAGIMLVFLSSAVLLDIRSL